MAWLGYRIVVSVTFSFRIYISRDGCVGWIFIFTILQGIVVLVGFSLGHCSMVGKHSIGQFGWFGLSFRKFNLNPFQYF